MHPHIPVLLQESSDLLAAKATDCVYDLTVGAGGHAEMFFQKVHKHGYLIGFDQDKFALNYARKRLKNIGENFQLIHANFVHFIEYRENIPTPNIIFADLGVSSIQIDSPERGFSFRFDGPLDMRMNTDSSTTAYDILMMSSAAELESLFIHYGEEKPYFAREIAQKIVENREKGGLKTTFDLVRLITAVKIKKNKKSKKHPALHIFQALRLSVNRELECLERMLSSSFNILSVGGKIGIISFHSLEDRIVKRFFRYWSQPCLCPKVQLICNCSQKYPKKLRIIKPFPALPSLSEIQKNPRSRSAKLRVAEVVERK